MTPERRKLIIANDTRKEREHWWKTGRKTEPVTAWWYWRPRNGDKDKSRGLERLPHWVARETPEADSEDGPLIKASVLEVIFHKVYSLPLLRLSDFWSKQPISIKVRIIGIIVTASGIVITVIITI